MEQKPMLIFVHGMFCHSGVWDEMVSYFTERGYECLAIDLPFHDQPQNKPPDPRLAKTSIKDYVSYLLDLVKGVNREYILIGHSMGGLIVMLAAGEEAVEPRSIILLSPAAPSGIMAFRWSVFKTFYKTLRTPYFWEKTIKMTREEISYSMLNRLPAEERGRIYDTLKHESGKAAFEMGFWFADPEKVTEVNPENITCPITIFIGTHDRITPHDVVTATAKKLGYKKPKSKKLESDPVARVELISLKGHGHWLLTEMDFALLEEKLKK